MEADSARWIVRKLINYSVVAATALPTVTSLSTISGEVP